LVKKSKFWLKNQNFGQSSKLQQEIEFFRKIQNCDKKFKFESKNEIVPKNLNFRKKKLNFSHKIKTRNCGA